MAQSDIRSTIRIGLIAGIIGLSVSAIGMVETFNERDIITGILTLGQLLLFSIPAAVGYLVARSEDDTVRFSGAAFQGALAGLISALPLVGLIILTTFWENIRDFLINVSPALVEILTFGQDPLVGSILLVGLMTVLSLFGALLHVLPERIRKPLLNGLIWTLGIGLFSEILLNILRPFPQQLVRIFFGRKGITVGSAVIIFVIATGFTAWWNARGRERYHARTSSMTTAQRTRVSKGGQVGLVVLLLLLPWILGVYLTNVLDTVGIFVIMGLGLNIVVGFAGLLDLGYVAFYAIGAYMMGLLTSTGDLGIAGMSFWVALPFCVLAATLFGMILGVPVLRMRGDYLAIVTLGFGEIIRVLARSDVLKEVIGGAQGIIAIGSPSIPALSFAFDDPQTFYYLVLAGCGLALFVSSRLRDRRPGRRWMALREDEDVAEAMGINLVSTKLLAFAIGAAFAGLAGALFATRIGSIFPNSFELLISINVLCLIIVGGIGSLPGVVVGALALVGLPELLREFAEYRLLIYGALLIVMMLMRPEGLWPSPIRKRELHASDEEAEHEGIQHEQVTDLI